MLQIKEGDLFAHAKAPCVIAHGVNAKGVMGSGFAKEIRKRYPLSYLIYIQSHREDPLQVGDLIIVNCDQVQICHCVTQENYGRDPNVVYVDYKAVKNTLKHVVELAKASKLPVHLPLIGGGLANGDRNKLIEIFKSVFQTVDATLWLN